MDMDIHRRALLIDLCLIVHIPGACKSHCPLYMRVLEIDVYRRALLIDSGLISHTPGACKGHCPLYMRVLWNSMFVLPEERE